jgi:hypothetical protein
MTYEHMCIYEIIGKSRLIYDRAYLKLESMESIGHKRTSGEIHCITRKEKPSSEAISSEGHC